jgi:hypothetical protein
MNRNGQGSIIIGFQFLQHFYLRGIEIVLFQCPVQGIGITGVKIYSSFIFPAFISAASSLLVTHSSPPSDNCQSLSTISIPIQPPIESSSYFIEFLFTGGSSVHQLNWLYLGEIRFSDEAPTSTTNTESEGEIRIKFNTHAFNYIRFLYMIVTSNPTKIDHSTLIPISSTTEDSNGGNQSISQVDTQASSIDNTHSMTPTMVSTNSELEIKSSNSIAITVGTLAGVIGLLIIVLTGIFGFFPCFYFYTRKCQQSLLEAPQNQNVNNFATEIASLDEQNMIPMFTNSCYQKRSSLLVPDPPTISGQYDDTDVHYYDVIPEDVKRICEKESITDNGQSVAIVTEILAPQCAVQTESVET